MKKDFICGLDIGTSKICACYGGFESSGKINILGNVTIAARGIKSGRIIDAKKLSACIKEAIARLRKICGIKFKQAYINIDNPDLKTKTYQQKVSFKRKQDIEKIQIDNLINSAIKSDNLSLGRKVIHRGFKKFILNNDSYELNLNIVIVSALIPIINSFIKCIKDAGLKSIYLAPSVCVQALGLLENFGCREHILIDVGSGLTKIALFKNKLVKDMVILPVGAQVVTEDIAARLKLSFDCAERLKVRYGRAICEERFLNQRIIVKDKKVNRVIESRQLYEVIIFKVDCLLQEIRRALSRLNYDDEKLNEITITGGGSILEGFLERADKVLGRPVKMGFLHAVNDSHIQAHSALYSTSVGLIHFGSKFKDKRRLSFRERLGTFTDGFERIAALYREYF